MNAQTEAAQQQQVDKATNVPGLPLEKTSSTSPVAPVSSAPGVPPKDIVIKRATFGDETSATDVTKTLTDQLDKKKYIKVVADQSLIPAISWFGGGDTTRLTRKEELEAQQKAQDDCGGGQNKSCVEVRKQQYSQSKLKEKAQKAVAADKVVKGRRLTVTYIDESGREQTVVVPDGNEFQVGAGSEGPVDPFSFNAVLWKLIYMSTTLVVVVGWVYSVVATYRTFLQAGYRWLGYAATAASIFIPYSGFFIMFGFFMFKSVITQKPESIAAYVPTTIESLVKRPGATIGPLIKSTEPRSPSVAPGERSRVGSLFS